MSCVFLWKCYSFEYSFPSTNVITTAKLDAMSHKWLASLSNYNFKLNYKNGKSIKDADSLFRRPAEIFPNVIKALTSA